ncbi:cytochrome P450 [Aspergillus cavernicola]|uniref:Cytochrome P450 n=1 Tax=Aspergillus cavernicola TaxID=176166 RepID=A0ABR4I117_9EURO
MDFQLLSTPAFVRVLASLLGLTTYILHYHRGEHHLFPQRNVSATLALYFLCALGLKSSDASITTNHDALSQAATLTALYLAGIFTGLLVYRLLMNPLNNLPGLPLARITGFAHTFHTSKKMDRHVILYDAHKKWGNFVRYGPNDISVSDADAVRVALGPSAVCIKAPWYSFEYPGCALISVREPKAHSERRRFWSPAFSDKALRGYEVRIKRYNESLLRRIDEFDGKPMNIAKWFECWSFDIMGDLAFGQSFNMLESPDGHWAISLLKEAQRGGGLSIPNWGARLLFAFPALVRDYFKLVKFCAEQIENRISVQGKQQNQDISHFLIQHYLAPGKSETEKKAELSRLHFDSKLIVVAGSDTTASTMTFLFYRIAREPGLLERLREEINNTMLTTDGGAIDHQKIQSAPLLNGCIYETLRLHPAVPSGLPRKTPPEGVYVGERYIPGNTVMLVNFSAMGRDESNFVAADKFIPERFSTRPELIRHKDAFVPFSTGPAGCIGKNLALMEMRLMTAHLVTGFDVAFAPGEDGTDLLNSEDHFTVALKPLHLLFKRRETPLAI